MHIGLICDEYPPGPHGGVGSFTGDLADGLVEAGHRVTVFVVEMGGGRYWSSPVPKMDTARNPRIIPVPIISPAWMRWRPGALWSRWKLLQIVRAEHAKNRFEVIECMDNGGLLPFGGPRGIPAIIRLHGATFLFDYELGSTTSDPFTHWMEKRALAKATHLVAVSEYIGCRELELAGLPRKRDRVIYNAVDTNLFSSDPATSTENGLIVFANTIHSRKGVLELCKAMNVVGQTHPHARLLMIGMHMPAGRGGRLFKDEALDAVLPEFRDRITFTGRLDRSEVRMLLRKAHLCCYPSKLEGFGIAPVEAMALGKPTIYSNTGPGAEVIEDGVSGLLCDPTDPEDIARKIQRILDKPALAESLGRKARERVVALFSKDNWVEKNAAFYRDCLR